MLFFFFFFFNKSYENSENAIFDKCRHGEFQSQLTPSAHTAAVSKEDGADCHKFERANRKWRRKMEVAPRSRRLLRVSGEPSKDSP
jgi:hypothetical protein